MRTIVCIMLIWNLCFMNTDTRNTVETAYKVSFQMNQADIQERYEQDVSLHVRITGTHHKQWTLLRQEQGKAPYEIACNWQSGEGYVETMISCADGDDIQYLLYEKDNAQIISQSAVTTIDSRAPRLRIFADGRVQDSMPAYFMEEQDITVSWEDEHLDKSRIRIIEVGEDRTETLFASQGTYHVTPDFQYMLKAYATDTFHHEQAYENEASLTMTKDWCILHLEIPIFLNGDVMKEDNTTYAEVKTLTTGPLYNVNSTTSYVKINEEMLALTNDEEVGYRVEKRLSQGVYQMSYHIEDACGHVVDKTLPTITIDISRPILILKSASGWYGEQTEIQFLLQHPPAQLSDIQLVLKHNDKIVQAQVEWSRSSEGLKGVLKLVDDGVYTLYSENENLDIMSLQTSITWSDIFFGIDTQRPQISFSAMRSEQIQREPQSISAQVKDVNLTQCSLIIQNTMTNTIEHNSCNSDGFVSAHMSDDGTYQYYVEANDSLGHQIKSEVRSITIDTTNPQIELFTNGVIKGDDLAMISNQDMEITYQCVDATLQTCQLFLQEDNLEWQRIEHSSLQLSAEKQKRHDYHIRVVAMDGADHVSQREVMVSTSTIPPLPQLAQKALPISNESFLPTLVQDGDLQQVVDVVLFKDQVKVPYQWGDLIVEEGDYVLDILVGDEALNVAHLQEPMQFTIDYTPPVIGLYQHTVIEDTTARIDRSALYLYIRQDDYKKALQETIMQVYVNNEELDISDIQQDASGRDYIALLPNDHTLDIRAIACDDAGNQMEYNWKLSVTVSPYPLMNANSLYGMSSMVGSVLFGMIICGRASGRY